MNLHQLPLVGALLLTAGGVAAIFLSDNDLPELALPGGGGDARIKQLALQVPSIANFEQYYGVEGTDAWRNLNPFVPWNERERELLAMQPKPQPEVAVGPAPTEPKAVPAIVVEPIKYPPLASTQSGVKIVSVVDSPISGLTLGVVIGARPPVDLRIGGVTEGWTLRAVEGGVATFASPDGGEVVVPLEVVGVTEWALADAGGATGETVSPTDSGTKPPPADPASKAMGETIIRQMMATPDGKRALENIPGLKERILANPQQAMQYLQRQQGGR